MQEKNAQHRTFLQITHEEAAMALCAITGSVRSISGAEAAGDWAIPAYPGMAAPEGCREVEAVEWAGSE